ncbi:MAG TPA: arsenate reductase ArsC [Candidatus Deferrimicrobiaceae bacterium]|nr:arsenate reductase ArsC [Candidatus Deferrimicrobiaceae bacterium]
MAKGKAKGSREGRKTVLFLCTGNACRSQMAEGWAKALKSEEIEVFSAGVAPCYVHPTAIRIMAEAGVDISGQYSKHVEEMDGIRFDYIVTLCDHAGKVCPYHPGLGKRVHRPFEDPVYARGTEEQVLARFRDVRDQIRRFVEGMPENLEDPAGEG